MTPPRPPAAGPPDQVPRFVGLVNGRPTPLPPGIAARVDITPQTVQQAAQNFATGQQHLADAWMRLQSGLNANAGMAGTGAPAAAFTSQYDPALKTVWKGFEAGIVHLGGTSKGLTQTANNHLKADHHSRATPEAGGPERLPFAQVYPSMSMAEPASATGTGGSGLPGPLAKLWPNASVGRLNAAAGVWRAAAKEIEDIGSWLQWTVGTITDTSSGADIDAMYGYYEKLWTPAGGGLLGALQDACVAMANACEQYAAKVTSARTKMKWELAAAGIGVALTTAGGLILTAPTVGASDAGAAAADAAEVSAILAPTARELIVTVRAAVMTALSGDVIGAITLALSSIPTITVVETEVEEDIEPILDDEMAAAEASSSLTESQLQEAREYACQEPKLEHVIDPPKHGLDYLVKLAGGRSEAMSMIVDSLKTGDDLPESGRFAVNRLVGGVMITIRGAVVNGVPKIGTAFNPSAFPGN